MTSYSSTNSRLHLPNSKEVLLTPELLGSGGEGNVYSVFFPFAWRGHVAKIYHPGERTPEREKKLEYMLLHGFDMMKEARVIWPRELLYENGNFVGYLMEKTSGAYDLTVLNSLEIPSKLPEPWHQKYTRKHISGFLNRCKLCYNIAKAVDRVHQSGNYVLVDLKPENIRISLEGNVFLIDTDSIQILKKGELLHPAEKMSNEYSPAESKTMHPQKDLIPKTWDRFSLGVIFYKVLFGLHPYTGTPGEAYNRLTSYAQKIQEGLLPLGKRSVDFEVIPPLHKNFQVLSESLQKLFLDCLEEGHLCPEKRPSAKAWLKAFGEGEVRQELYQNPGSLIPKTARAKSKQVQVFDVNSPSFVGGTPSLILGVFFTEKLTCIELDREDKKMTLHYKKGGTKKLQRQFDLEEIDCRIKVKRMSVVDKKNHHKALLIFQKYGHKMSRKIEIGRIEAVGRNGNEEVLNRLKKVLEKEGLIDI